MNKYETVILMDANISKEKREETIEKIKNYINENGNITYFDDLGLKKLAYEVRNNKEAYYYSIKFEIVDKEVITKLERLYRITEEIIKFIVIRVNE